MGWPKEKGRTSVLPGSAAVPSQQGAAGSCFQVPCQPSSPWPARGHDRSWILAFPTLLPMSHLGFLRKSVLYFLQEMGFREQPPCCLGQNGGAGRENQLARPRRGTAFPWVQVLAPLPSRTLDQADVTGQQLGQQTLNEGDDEQEGRPPFMWCGSAHLLQGLHELLHGDGAAQQRLHNLAVWHVLRQPLPLLTAWGLCRPGWGLEQDGNMVLSVGARADHHELASSSQPGLGCGLCASTVLGGRGTLQFSQSCGSLLAPTCCPHPVPGECACYLSCAAQPRRLPRKCQA